jgi:hypothetical protein
MIEDGAHIDCSATGTHVELKLYALLGGRKWEINKIDIIRDLGIEWLTPSPRREL